MSISICCYCGLACACAVSQPASQMSKGRAIVEGNEMAVGIRNAPHHVIDGDFHGMVRPGDIVHRRWMEIILWSLVGSNNNKGCRFHKQWVFVCFVMTNVKFMLLLSPMICKGSLS